MTMYPLITAEQYAADRARHAAERLPCKCGTRLAVQIVCRDMGEREWLRATGVGVVAVRVIKEIIDRAAAGENVTTARTGTHSYVPQPWPRSFP